MKCCIEDIKQYVNELCGYMHRLEARIQKLEENNGWIENNADVDWADLVGKRAICKHKDGECLTGVFKKIVSKSTYARCNPQFDRRVIFVSNDGLELYGYEVEKFMIIEKEVD